MPAVICDTSPLQYLHQTELLRLLPALFGVVVMPPAVVSELNEGKRERSSSAGIVGVAVGNRAVGA